MSDNRMALEEMELGKMDELDMRADDFQEWMQMMERACNVLYTVRGNLFYTLEEAKNEVMRLFPLALDDELVDLFDSQIEETFSVN